MYVFLVRLANSTFAFCEVKRCAKTQTRISLLGLSQHKNISGSFLRYCSGCKKKRFCEDKRIDFFGEVFLGFLIGVITAWVN